MVLNISCKSMSRRGGAVTSVPYRYDNEMDTVRDFLAETVKLQVAQYERRQEESEVLRVLSAEGIAEKSRSGKIGFGRIYGERKPDVAAAISTALECFQDGLVALFVDGDRMENLDDALHLHEGSEITFVRLAMLSGRMW